MRQKKYFMVIIALSLALLVVSLCYYREWSRAQKPTYNDYKGRLFNASLFDSHSEPLGRLSIKKETAENILADLLDSGLFSELEYKEKLQFTLMVLLNDDIQGGSMMELLMLLNKDARPIAEDIKKIPAKELLEHFRLSPQRIERLHTQLDFLIDPYPQGHKKDRKNRNGKGLPRK